jgi:hypothetical protein
MVYIVCWLTMILCRFVTDFIDVFFRENARRAMTRDPPLSVREAKERWNEMLDRRAAFHRKGGGKQESGQAGPSWRDGARHDGGRGRGGGRRGGGTGAPRGGNSTKTKGARHNGEPVCYHFNRVGGCTRTAKGSGCDNGIGGVYAHVCNFEVSLGKYCLDKHPKAGNH